MKKAAAHEAAVGTGLLYGLLGIVDIYNYIYIYMSARQNFRHKGTVKPGH